MYPLLTPLILLVPTASFSSLPYPVPIFFIPTLSFSSPSVPFLILLVSSSSPPRLLSLILTRSHPLLILFIPLVFFFIHPQPSQSLLNLHVLIPALSFSSSPLILFFSTLSFISIFNAIIWNEERTPTTVL